MKVLGYCEDPVALVYEYMEGGDLQAALETDEVLKNLSLQQRLQILAQVAKALRYLHVNGILHKDIKPSNIMLTWLTCQDGSKQPCLVAKICDLGLAREIQEGHLSSEWSGTLPYLDPQYLQKYKYTEASDVYAFGLVLLQTICGEKDINKVKQLIEKMNKESTSFEAAGQLFLDSRMPGTAPQQVLQELAFLGAACVSTETNYRPNMGAADKSDKDTVVERLAALEELLSGSSTEVRDQRAWEAARDPVSALPETTML